MTEAQWIAYLDDAVSTRAAYPSLRMGQAYFNVLYDKFPEIADSYRATELDPFYNDGLIPAFLNDIYEQHVA